MFSRRPDSLQLQLLSWLLVPLMLLLLVNAWFANQQAVAMANMLSDRLLLASAEAIAEDVEVRNGRIFVDLPYAALQLLESNIQERLFYRVVGPDGKTITGYDDLPLPAGPPAQDEKPQLYASDYQQETVHQVALRKHLYASDETTWIVVVVGETGEARGQLARQLLVSGLLRQGLLIVLAAGLVWLGLVRGLRPLGRLRASVLARPVSDLSPIDPSGVQSEVRPLIEALNQHMARIGGLLASRQRFIADASHQMRSPLAEMSTQIEFSLRQDEPAFSHAVLKELHGDVGRLARLISQMLLQARVEPEAQAQAPAEPVDLCALARDVALDHVPAARRKSIDLSFDGPAGPLVVGGNGLLLRELVINLVDNAIACGRTAGCVELRVSRGSEAGAPVVLEVSDDGPGIAEAERDKVFGRFYRSRGAPPGGSGLGLSIVRDICSGHGAGVSLHAGIGGAGLCVRVVFAAPPGLS